MTLDFSKPIITRDGRAVRILCTDGPGNEPVIGIVGDSVLSWHKDGKHFVGGGPSGADLINQPVKRRGWANLYKDRNGRYVTGERVYDTEEEARMKKGFPGRYVATVQLSEWEVPSD